MTGYLQNLHYLILIIKIQQSDTDSPTNTTQNQIVHPIICWSINYSIVREYCYVVFQTILKPFIYVESMFLILNPTKICECEVIRVPDDGASSINNFTFLVPCLSNLSTEGNHHGSIPEMREEKKNYRERKWGRDGYSIAGLAPHSNFLKMLSPTHHGLYSSLTH